MHATRKQFTTLAVALAALACTGMAGARWGLHRPPADFAEIKERAQARA